MLALLKFDLPEEQYAFESAAYGSRWRGVVFDLDNYLREQIKYNAGLAQEAREALQCARDYLWEAKSGIPQED